MMAKRWRRNNRSRFVRAAQPTLSTASRACRLSRVTRDEDVELLYDSVRCHRGTLALALWLRSGRLRVRRLASGLAITITFVVSVSH